MRLLSLTHTHTHTLSHTHNHTHTHSHTLTQELEQEHKQRSCATNATDNNTNAPLRAPSPGNLVAPPPPPPPPSLGKAAARHSQLPGTNMNSATAQQGAQEAGNDAQTATATQVCASTRPAHVSAKASATPSQAGELKAVLERSARSREAGVDAEVEADGDEGRQSVSRSNRYGVCKSNAPKSPSARFCAMPASRGAQEAGWGGSMWSDSTWRGSLGSGACTQRAAVDGGAEEKQSGEGARRGAETREMSLWSAFVHGLVG